MTCDENRFFSFVQVFLFLNPNHLSKYYNYYKSDVSWFIIEFVNRRSNDEQGGKKVDVCIKSKI